jgi:putative ABC transport system permease protein
MRALAEDVWQAFRALRQTRWFAAGIVLTLALGIGANAAVFSILHAVLLQRLPYHQPDGVVMVWSGYERAPGRGAAVANTVLAWREIAPDVLQDVAGIKIRAGFPADLLLPDRAERLRTGYVTPNFFDLLGVRPIEGRLFTSADETSEGGDVVVLSHALWRTAFNADPAVIGRPLTLVIGRVGAKPFTIVAVLPPEFRFTYPLETQVWIMQRWREVRQDAATRAVTHDGAIARLKPGVTVETAQARLSALSDRIFPARSNAPAEQRQVSRLEPSYDWVVGETRPSLLLLGGVAVLLLLITCATVSGALLVRVTRRQREMALRAALGADRRRLLTQLLTEGAVLAGAGAIAGTLLAIVLHPVLRALVPPIVPRGDEIGVSFPLLLFAAATAGLTTILSGLAPAWRGANFDVMTALKRVSAAASTDRSSARWRQALVALQAAIASALLISAALLLTSFWRLSHMPLGFDGDRVWTIEIRLQDPKYRQPHNVTLFREGVLSRIRGIPGVLEAGLSSAVPFRGTDFMHRLNRTGDKSPFNANGRAVDPSYFQILRIPLIRGRLFSAADVATGPPVMVVSESFARTVFGGEEALGQYIDVDAPTEIVGIVGDLRYVSLDKEPYPAFYRPDAQWNTNLFCVVARTAPNSPNPGAAIRQAIREVDPAQPAMNLTTIDRIIHESIADRRFYTTATTAFASLALLLTVIGMTIVVARTVVERHKELAIRSALGATPGRLIRAIVGEGVRPVLAGTFVGLISAYAAATVLTRFLFNTVAREPQTFVAIAVLIVMTSALASLVPARRVLDTGANALRSE